MFVIAAAATVAVACGSGEPAADAVRSSATTEAEVTTTVGSALAEQAERTGQSRSDAVRDSAPGTGTDVAEIRVRPSTTEAVDVISSAVETAGDADIGTPRRTAESAGEPSELGAEPESAGEPSELGAEPESAGVSASSVARVGEDDELSPADDPSTANGGGLGVEADRHNSAPVAVGAIPAQELAAGGTLRVQLVGYFDDADGDVLTFTAVSSDSQVLTVPTTARSVWLQSVAAGSATVTVTARDGDGLTAEQTFEVTAELVVASVDVSGTTTLRSVGETSSVAVTVEFSDGSRRAVDGARVAWESSDAAVVTVSEGVLTAVGRGRAWVTATYMRESAQLRVSVRVPAMVRVVYAVPSDREFRSDYSDAVQQAIVAMQSWYRRQLDGLTFSLGTPTPQHCRMSQLSDYFARDSWHKVVDELQHCAPVSAGSEGFSWVVYADVVDECGPWELGFDSLGRGTDGLTIMAREDLQGLVDEDDDHYYCQDGELHGPVDDPHGRWVGGGAHELGHTFLLHHPPGCDEGRDTCDDDALMGYGWFSYPDTYLRPEEKETLIRSAFFRTPAPSEGERSGTQGRTAVTGTVVDPDGAPVGGVRVSLVADAFWAWAQTDPSGSFDLRLPAGSTGPAVVSVHAGEAADCGWLGYHSAGGLATAHDDADTVTARSGDPAHVEIALPARVAHLCRRT